VIREGAHYFDPFDPTNPPATGPATGPNGEPLIDPVAEYDHNDGVAVIGGFVYRGSLFPQLQGKYIFGDWTAGTGGRIFYLSADGDLSQIFEFQLDDAVSPLGFILGFGEDDNGELFVMTSATPGPGAPDGLVFHITPEPATMVVLALLAVAMLLALLAITAPARGSYHLWQVSEVFRPLTARFSLSSTLLPVPASSS
jgi:hypothetical protein